VENAIYHGLKHKPTFGRLTVTGRQAGQRLVLTVCDDGAGMNEERLTEVRAGLLDPRQQAGYGMSSVHERIKLYFGDSYGLAIDSGSGGGTVVTVELPLDARQEGE
jgi:two-component system sensor histidine kinase YesM